MTELTREQTQQIIDAADEVITALAGTNDEVHKDDTNKMVRLWDNLNDRHAPPEVVRQLARMALAAMGSEPVAYTDERNLGYINQGRETAYLWGKQNSEPADVALYRHAQPAPVVSDFETVLKNLDYDVRCNIRESEHVYQASKATYDACRAAMLNHPSSIQPNTDAAPGTEIKHPSSNSPVIPDGYVMVPKEPTKEMIDAGWLHFMGTKNPSSKGTYKAMLAAAPQEVKSES